MHSCPEIDPQPLSLRVSFGYFDGPSVTMDEYCTYHWEVFVHNKVIADLGSTIRGGCSDILMN
jgi:hypothetical protein